MIATNSIRNKAVNVLIGPNGSGKSRLLRELSLNFLRDGDEVIAIAPTIYDRFKGINQARFHFFGARQGRFAARNVIRSALAKSSSDTPQILKDLTQALKYTNFDPCIGMRLSKINPEACDTEIGLLKDAEREELHSALLKFKNNNYEHRIACLSLDNYSFSELSNLSLAVLAGFEDILYRAGAISRIEYFLFRNGEPIPLLDACSGEICFITTIAFISTQIKKHCVIAIDEPDTSLHPTWQQNYVKTLLDLFHRYEPCILVSTHSPIIISGAEVTSNDVSVYEMKSGEPHIFAHANLSLEEMYDKLFGLITPKNHYLSQRAVAMLNALNAGDRNLEQVVHDLEVLRARSYDESQQMVITKFEEMAHKLDVIKRSQGA